MHTVDNAKQAPLVPYILIIVCILAALSTSWAGEKKVIRFRPGDPPLLTEEELPRPRRNRDREAQQRKQRQAGSEKKQTLGEAAEAQTGQQTALAGDRKPDAKVAEFSGAPSASPVPAGESKAEPAVSEREETPKTPRRRGIFSRRARVEEAAVELSATPEISEPSSVSRNDAPAIPEAPAIANSQAIQSAPDKPHSPMPVAAAGEAENLDSWSRELRILPTRDEVEIYRKRLELRLLERYNNLPDHAGNVAKVSVILSKPLDEALDGSRIRAEFDQLVYDPWGKRIPALEKEYYVVVFGSGGAQQVRSDPSIRVGLDLEKTYSEKAPLAADPFRNVTESAAFRPAPQARMPEWWRPDFPELD